MMCICIRFLNFSNVISRSHHICSFEHRRKFLTNKAFFFEITDFLYFTPYGMVDRYHPIGGICCLHPQDRPERREWAKWHGCRERKAGLRSSAKEFPWVALDIVIPHHHIVYVQVSQMGSSLGIIRLKFLYVFDISPCIRLSHSS